MRYFKCIFIFIVLLLLCGCSVTYNVDVTNEIITENISILDNKSKYDENPFEIDEPNIAYTTPGLTPYYYEQEDVSNNEFYGINLKYKYKINNYKRSQIIESCYTNRDINNSDSEFSIKLSGFRCLNYAYEKVDKITINLVTDNNIISNNADAKEDDVLTWVIDESNYEEHEIDIVIDKSNTKRNGNFLTGLIPFVWILLGVAILIVIIVIVMIRKQKKNNKI